MTKGVKICIWCAAAIFLAALLIAVYFFRPSDSNKVVILRDNEVLYEIDLAEITEKDLRIEYTGGGYNIVEIRSGEICISDADCPDKTCVKTGKLRSENIPIVCLPHHLVIRYSDEVTP